MKGSSILVCCILVWFAEYSMQHETKAPKCNCNCEERWNPCDKPCKVKLAPVPGYQLVSGLGYYKVYTKYTDWETAMKRCKAEGANLVIINSDAEAKAMNQLMKQSGTAGFGHWTGTFMDESYRISTIEADTPRTPLFLQPYPVENDGTCGSYVTYTTYGVYYRNCNFTEPSICESEL